MTVGILNLNCTFNIDNLFLLLVRQNLMVVLDKQELLSYLIIQYMYVKTDMYMYKDISQLRSVH